MNFQQGDWVTVTALADGGLKIRPSDPGFEKVMEIAEKAMKDYRNALKELAK